jgi:LmbE family N-acetylglucosaminyl deacetylase
MRDWRELTGRTLVLVAHADDESVGYGALMQRMREAVVVIATGNAPRDPYFWQRFGSREAYQSIRREEARAAMRLAGAKELIMLADEDERLEDQRLFLNLAAAYERLARVARRIKPEAIATLAYEGGHPDHDSCSVLGWRLGIDLKLPVWEAPLYHRGNIKQDRKKIAVQHFLRESGGEVRLEIDAAELERKRSMCAQYASQGDFLRVFDAGRETMRPQASYNYGKPPHEGETNYEAWQWWMSAREVCEQFRGFLGV